MKVVRQIDANTRVIQFGKVPNVALAFQRQRWWGWKTINSEGTFFITTVDEFIKDALDDEQRRKKPYYGRIVHTEKF